LFSPDNYPHKSGAIFQINLYVFNIHKEIPNGINKLNHVKRLAVFQNESFTIPYKRMNHLCHQWNKHMLTIVQNTFYSHCGQWFPLVNERFVINNSVAIPILFFELSVTNNAAKPNCVLPIGDNGSLYKGCSSGELFVMKINETQLLCKAAVVSLMQTLVITL
jgi:hypothetical protein